MELLGLGVGRAGHAGQLLVEAEEVLVADGGEGLVLLLDLHPLLGLDGLVQAVGPATARHLPAGELVDDDDGAVVDQVVDVALVEGVGPQGLGHVVQPGDVFGVVEVADPKPVLDPVDAGVGQHGRVGLLVDVVVDVLAQRGDDGVDLLVEVRRLLGRSRDDEGGAGLVDEDRVDLVDDGEVQIALNVPLDRVLHVVTQVVEPELRVHAVRDVAAVGLLPLPLGEAVDDDPHRHAEEVVDAPHPLGVAAGQVVVDGDDVDALAGEGVEVTGEGGHQGLALAGLHLGDAPLVQHHAAHELDVEVPHVEHTPAGLAHGREGLRDQLVEGLPLVEPAPELGGEPAQLFIRPGLHAGLELTDASDERPQRTERAGVLGAEDSLEDVTDHAT